MNETKQVAVATTDINQVMEKVLLAGDLAKMEPKERINYYLKTCESLGMNPMTKPFDLITLNSKMVLYPNRAGGDQLRKIGNVDIQIIKQEFDKETQCYEVTARAKLPNGRTDEDMGIVPCGNLRGDALANAKLKAVTKAKRRVTLSIMGLGWIDESEVGSVRGAKIHKIDLETGKVIDVSPNQSDGNKQEDNTSSQFEKIKLQKQMVELVNQKGIPPEEVKHYLKEKFSVESSKLLNEEQLKIFITWLSEWTVPQKEEVKSEMAPWEQELVNDPKMVK